jgi:hypothetical protein
METNPLSPVETLFRHLSRESTPVSPDPCNKPIHVTRYTDKGLHCEDATSESRVKKDVIQVKRKHSFDELSETSSVTEVDDYLPEVEMQNAPPEMMKEAYEAALQVSMMFGTNHTVSQPCTHIPEESENKDVRAESSSLITPAELSKLQAEDVKTDAKAESDDQHSKKQDELMNVVEQVCQTCSEKTDKEEIVKSEEVTTQEVTLVFNWPKRKGRKIPKSDDLFRELHMRRVLKITDLDVELIEGPTVTKSITYPQKDADEDASGDKKSKQSTKKPLEMLNTDEIVTDIDVKISTVKYGPDQTTPVRSDQYIKGSAKSIQEVTGEKFRSIISPDRQGPGEATKQPDVPEPTQSAD